MQEGGKSVGKIIFERRSYQLFIRTNRLIVKAGSTFLF